MKCAHACTLGLATLLAVFALAACGDEAARAERRAFIEAMNGGANEVCACDTADCVERANRKIQTAKNPSTALTFEEEKELDEVIVRLRACDRKVRDADDTRSKKRAAEETSASERAAVESPAAPASSAAPR